MKRIIHNLSIRQSILLVTLGVVLVSLLVTSIIYYSSFSGKTNSLIESQSREINKQIVLNYESYINSVIETANYIQASSLNLDIGLEFEKLQRLYTSSREIKKDVVSIMLFDNAGNRLLGSRSNAVDALNIVSEPWFSEAKNKKEIFHFSAPYKEPLSTGRTEQIISVSKSIEYTQNAVKKNGVLLIELNFQTITGLADKTNLGDGGLILILDADDALIYASEGSGKETLSQSMGIAAANYFGGLKTLVADREMYMNINTLLHTRWRIVTCNNVDDLASANRQMSFVLFIIFIASSAVTSLLAFLISSGISRPLNQLKRTMLKIEKGDFETKLIMSGQKEVTELAGSFNRMIDRIRTLMKKVVDEQKEKRKTELVALQNQINPHFLYNTLDSIVWLAENRKTNEVITTVLALAKFFRISISRGEIFIPVKDEIDHINSYLTIQSNRYLDKFDYAFDFEEGIADLKVMKLILQPIVENAIYHGIGDEKELITIRGGKRDGFLFFEVENTGYGLSDERISEMYSIMKGLHVGKSVGIRNVYQRLKLYYGEEANMVITSRQDETTNVKLLIPLNRFGSQKGGENW